MRLRAIFSLLAVVAIVAIAAGCGSSDSSGTSGSSGSGTGSTSAGSTDAGSTDGTTQDGTTQDASGKSSGPPLTKAKFIQEGESICQNVPVTYNETLKELEEEAKKEKKPKPSTEEGNLKAAVPPLYAAAEEFEALSPPKGDEKEVAEIIDALEVAAKGLEEKPSSELTGPKSPFAEFQKVTGEYGFNFCSQL